MTTVSADHDLKPLPLWQCGIALSSALAVFGAWAWLTATGMFDGRMTSSSAGYFLLAALSIVLQVSSNFAAAAARRARAFDLTLSFRWSVGLMTAGAVYNAFSVHHAFEVTGFVGPGVDQGFAYLVVGLSAVLAGFEPALYWIDEALKGEASERVRVRDAAAAAAANVVPLPAGADRGRKALGAAGAVLLAAASATAGGFGAPSAQAETRPIDRSLDRPPSRIVRPSGQAQRAIAEARALELLRADPETRLSRRAIERETGLHRDTIERLAATIPG